MKKPNGAPKAPQPDVEPPAELQKALAADAQARHSYERLSPSHRREYARWVSEAKKEETRARRAARALEMLRAGRPPK